MLKIGLLGAGMMGGVHSEMWSKIPDVKVTAISLIQDKELPKIQKNHPDVRHFKNEADFFNSGLDAIDITLPTFMHKEYVEKGLAHRLDVITEKPLCRTVKEAEEILKLVQHSKKHVYVAHVIRFWPEYIYLKKILKSEKLGKLRSLYMGRYTEVPRWSVNDWLLKRPLSGATPLDLQIHDVDFILSTLGTPDDVHCRVLENGLHVFTEYFYKPDSVVVMEAGNDLPQAFGFEMTFHAIFENGMLHFSSRDKEGLMEFTDESEKVDLEKHANHGLGSHIPTSDSYMTELAHFVDCIKQNKPSEYVPVDTAARTIKMILENLQE
ncbi:Gfo/Idh/MocA family oxidoreductase [candidate division KSB1 bacterium]|nr:Gfo/Idh/MocA family oxidoreductase [candidate division KSB1 bacterium]